MEQSLESSPAPHPQATESSKEQQTVDKKAPAQNPRQIGFVKFYDSKKKFGIILTAAPTNGVMAYHFSRYNYKENLYPQKMNGWSSQNRRIQEDSPMPSM